MQRGSLTDAINLKDYPFFYEPKMRDCEKTGFAKREVFGNRLPSVLWIGQGGSDVTLDVYLLNSQSGPTVQDQIKAFKKLLETQDDIGAPHPLFINMGGMYVNRQYVLCQIDSEYLGFDLDASMAPYEAVVKMALCEIPKSGSYAGTGK